MSGAALHRSRDNAGMNSDAPSIPPVGKFAQVLVTAALEDFPAHDGRPFPPGVFLARPNILVVSHGSHASVLRFETADDAAGLAAALIELTRLMTEAEASAAKRADQALARVMSEVSGHA